ncbi:2'-5'-oligoadenylate synthase 1-like [Vipera latastei]
MELYSIPSNKLDGYIGTTLHPSEEFQKNVCDAVDRICSFLKEDCDLDKDTNVIRTIKAGSAGKGTALDMSSDVDLVIILSCFSSFRDQAEKRERVIKDIEKSLKKCIQTIAFKVNISPPRQKGTPPRSLSLLIQAKKKTESVEVDILPAYDALGPITSTYVPPKEVYIRLIEANGAPGEFNTSFTELQRNFVKRCPSKLKDLLRLVKHWYKEIRKQSSSTSPKLPPKFALELLTIYAWEEEKKGAEQFNTAEGFCTVMKLITQYQDLCFYWTKYYTLEDSKIGLHVKGKLKESRPVIIDPADPTANVAKANTEAWDLLAQKASDCLTQSCCMKNEEPIKPWNVQPARDIEVTVKQQTGAPKVISCNPFVPIKWIKKQIGKEGGICELCLEETALQNDKRLADYGIFYSTTFRITSQLNIFVKDLNSGTTNYTVNSSETVLGLKKMIEASKHIAVNQQRLTYHDKELEDGKTLDYYNIRSNETVYLLLRLRGGHWNGIGWDGIENNDKIGEERTGQDRIKSSLTILKI